MQCLDNLYLSCEDTKINKITQYILVFNNDDDTFYSTNEKDIINIAKQYPGGRIISVETTTEISTFTYDEEIMQHDQS